MCWALLWPIQVSFQVQGGPKMGVFLVKNIQNERMPYWPKKSTWKLDNGPKHTPSNWERCVGHLYAPSRWLSMSRWVQKWVLFGRIDKMPYWANQSTWKLDNGPKHTPSNGNSYVGQMLYKILWPPLCLFWSLRSLWQCHPMNSNSHIDGGRSHSTSEKRGTGTNNRV